MDYYRYADIRYSNGIDEFEHSLGYFIDVVLRTFEVTRQTPKGVWINYGHDKRFILENARKKFACATKEEALESFLARKKRQRSLLIRQLSDTNSAITICNKIKDEN
jgi:hypothetical protein